MINLIEVSTYVGIVSFLIFLPILCYMDIRYRRVPRWPLATLIVVNIPAVLILYSNGLPIAFIAISIVITTFYTLMYLVGAFKGGDWKILVLIAWFCILNPFNTLDNIFQIQYVIFLSGTSLLWMLYVYINNKLKNVKGTLWERMNRYPRGSPWMIPVTIAFYLAVIFA